MPSYTLYGAEISYYTGKVRAFLRWKGVPFREVQATGDIYREVIVPRVGFPVIPVLATPEGALLQDSTDIIDTLDQRHGEPSVVPQTPLQRLAASLLELYGDEWLLIPAMHYRWHHNREWALRAFGALNAPEATPEEQLALGTRRALCPGCRAARWKPPHACRHRALLRGPAGRAGPAFRQTPLPAGRSAFDW